MIKRQCHMIPVVIWLFVGFAFWVVVMEVQSTAYTFQKMESFLKF